MNVDVAVVGGGLAGVAAALRAEACGARVVLVERDAELGGHISAAYVHTLCGLFHSADDGPARYAHPGFPQDFAEAMRLVGAAGAPERAGRVFVLPIYPPRVAPATHALCRAAPGLELCLETRLVDAEIGVGGAELAVVRGGVCRRIVATSVVDASGDALCAALAGAETEEEHAESLQRPSFVFRLAGVECETIEGFGRLRLSHAVAGAARRGALPASCESLLVRRGEARDEVYVTLNLPPFDDLPYAPLDPENVAAHGARGESLAHVLLAFLKEQRPEFEGARLLAMPRRIGVRETRRIAGAVRLEGVDIDEGRRREDEVAQSTWPIELWQDHRRATFRYPQGPASIPLGSLISRSHPHLLAAGRCVAASHDALGALRVLGTSMATGEAAGIAAALAVDRGLCPAAITPDEIRGMIREKKVPAFEKMPSAPTS